MQTHAMWQSNPSNVGLQFLTIWLVLLAQSDCRHQYAQYPTEQRVASSDFVPASMNTLQRLYIIEEEEFDISVQGLLLLRVNDFTNFVHIADCCNREVSEAKPTNNAVDHIYRLQSSVLFFSDCFAISRDIAKYGYDLDVWYKMQMLDLLDLKSMLPFLSYRHNLLKFISAETSTSNASPLVALTIFIEL